jgi:hypothetical protein
MRIVVDKKGEREVEVGAEATVQTIGKEEGEGEENGIAHLPPKMISSGREVRGPSTIALSVADSLASLAVARSRSRSNDRSRDMISDQWAKDRDRKKAAESLTGLTGAQIERARAAMRGGGKDQRLNDDSYYHFKDLLDDLTVERESIKISMGYAFDHLDAHLEVWIISSCLSE